MNGLWRLPALIAICFGGCAASAEQLPAIKAGQLLVNGRGYLALGGELHNSSASDPEYMEPIWNKLEAMNVRTVLGTVSWEDFEPVEGSYDFRSIDAQIAQARRRNMRLVLIWFGAFKNASSTYAPTWVRRDPLPTVAPCRSRFSRYFRLTL
jgi:beta-galactosidase GanA